MLDFDGILAPIVVHPERARMSARTRRLLAACARRGRVAVISGRALADVRSRVSLRRIWYAGNHGAEWAMGAARGQARPSRATAAQLRDAKRAFTELVQRYPGAVVEDKKITFSVHFRGLARTRIPRFKKDAVRLARAFIRLLDIAEGSEYIFNVRGRSGRTKGSAVHLARQAAPRRMVAIYVGDDTTDEDAFRALPHGITIRVGKRAKSSARFCIRNRSEVDSILAVLAAI